MLLPVFSLLLSVHLCYGDLYCLTCSEVVSPRHCKSIRRCNDGQVCYTEKYRSITGETLYNVGCQTPRRCVSTKVNPFLQRMTSSRRYVYNPDTMECIECCSTADACNRDGCGSPDYPIIRGPACFDCQQTRDPRLCRSVAVCMEGEVCQTYMKTTFSDKIYTLACAPDFVCSQEYVKADRCNQCCKTDFCNKDLCDAPEGQIGFHAVLDRDQGSGVLVFGSVVTNVGQGYDPLTGYFSPRTNGTFVFTWNLESNTPSAVVALEVNGKEITTTQTQPLTYPDYSGSSFAILNLNPGDIVGLRLLNGTAMKAFTMFNGWKQNSDKLHALYTVPDVGNNSGDFMIITDNDALVNNTWYTVPMNNGFYLTMESYEGQLVSYNYGYPTKWVNNSYYYINNYGSFGFVFITESADYIPCNELENLATQVSPPLLDQNTNSWNCYDKMIRLDRSTTGVQTFKINKTGLYIFYIHVYTHGEAIISSLMVNGVEVLEMSTKAKEYYSGSQAYPTWNDVSMYPVLQLQTNDEVSLRNISGSFISGSFVGWSVAE